MSHRHHKTFVSVIGFRRPVDTIPSIVPIPVGMLLLYNRFLTKGNKVCVYNRRTPDRLSNQMVVFFNINEEAQMKKTIILATCALAACNNTTFIPYTGDKTILGEGGFHTAYISSKYVGLDEDYPNAGVAYYKSGLPRGQKCELIGYISDQNLINATKFILKLGHGNTATQSTVSFPLKFENNGGFLDANGSAGSFIVRNSMGTSGTTYHGYNLFHCE